MNACRVVMRSRFDPYRACGHTTPVSYCEKHQTEVHCDSITPETLCIFGRIEKALEEALAKIKAATP